ncbi:hypothetical protein B0H16DRAFT_1459527 [Mycena metata]|uniref:Uncharacterized protein n=1 Tax=Mycena metata TaxID=1033252 RepID=A0AAD7NB12_9AGAR|nr:hypothetical protein B0H16DRAFT_1459527 [Mycena metata]
MVYFGYLLNLGLVNGKFTLVMPYHVQLAPVLDREIQEIMGAQSKQPYTLMFELSTIPPSFKNAWEGQRSSIHGHFLQLGAERKLRLAKCYNLWSCMEQIKMSREQFIDVAGSQVFSAAIGSISGCKVLESYVFWMSREGTTHVQMMQRECGLGAVWGVYYLVSWQVFTLSTCLRLYNPPQSHFEMIRQ